MEKKVYLLIEHCIDNWDTHYEHYYVCSTKEKAKEKMIENMRLSTEIVSSSIKETTMYE